MAALISSVFLAGIYLSAFLFTPGVTSLGASTDTYTWGGDYLRNGYQPNHNMDPAVVGSSSFGQIFRTPLPGNFNGIGSEQVFSQPLVFTGNDGVQYVYLATTQNNLYKLNAKTGAIVSSRNMHVPFLTADLDGCVDINPTVGVTATGTIDPSTGIWYLTAKTYSDQFQNKSFGPSNPPGRLNGRYYFHGIDTQSSNLLDVFPPVQIDGRAFRNNPNRVFQGGNHHSRPGLVLAGNYIYTGYASHCVQYNFTGAIIGHDKVTGAVVEMFATEGGPEPNSVKGGGIWMSGGGITYDGSESLFFATGNGYASQLSNTPVPGRQPPSALEEAVVNAKIISDGTLSIIDFFMPWEKQLLDGADKDLGTTPLEILPPSVFKCTNVKRMGIITGKSGKTYVLNLDNLGGYQMGTNKLDNVIFVYQNENSVYAGAGVMPLGGGYIYINVIKYQTRVFKFSCDGSGNPQFTVVSNTAEFNANILGTGHGTTTSLNGQDGSGLYWVSDVEGLNLRIYKAIPPSDGGPLIKIGGFNIAGITKFTRPVFGDSRVYLGTTSGFFYGYGSPVNLPLNCSSPYVFGQVALKNTSAPVTITCFAQIGITITGIALSGNNNFKLFNLPNGNVPLSKGGSLSFQAVFNPQNVGPLSSDIIVNTTNSIAGYSANTPVTLTGSGNSVAPLLKIGPNTVSFNVIAGQQIGGVNQSSIFSNVGDSTLKIQNISFSLRSETGPWIAPNITAASSQIGPFTFYSVPESIPGKSQSTITINYNPTVAGNDACFLSVASDGGAIILDVVAVAGTSPIALIEFENSDQSKWTKLDTTSVFAFGNITENQTKYLRLRVTNNGTANAVPLSLTISKPPYGVQGIVGAVNNVDLAEGTLLAAGQSATATLYCSVPKSQVNVPAYQGSANWTMNTGDPALGKQFMQFICNAVSEQVGPLFNNGSARYGYIGCFRENNPGRQLSANIYTDTNGNTNEKCISACSAAGWIYAGTQYQQECWCGNAIPIQQDLERDCNYVCTGNSSQICGGNGYFADKARISLFADLTRFNNVTSPPLSIPPSANAYHYVGCYAEKGGKAMNSKVITDSKSMTVELCAAFCSSYPYFSVEYAQECYCGNIISSITATLTADSFCQTMTCKGNNSEYCGAGNYAQVYQLNGTKSSLSSISIVSTSSSPTTNSIPSVTTMPFALALTNYTYLGCYNETHDRRALNLKQGGGSSNTLNSCASFCLGFNYFGAEFGSECYCANQIYSNSVKQPTEGGCFTACSGNASQTCGGPDFLNVYYINATIVSTKTATGSTPVATGGPTAVGSIGAFKHIGCYNEVGGRALTASTVANSSMTVELCAMFCSSFQYFSVEYSQECYCGNSINPGSSASSSGDCTMTCAANPYELCGGPAWMNMYQKNGTTVSIESNSISVSITSPTSLTTPAVTSAPQRIGPWASLGCYTDNINGRALNSLYANNAMTLELCAGKALGATAQYFGVEYGIECWYGSLIGGSNIASDQSKCNMKCPGNGQEWCGAGNQLQIYNFSAASISSSSSLALSTTNPSGLVSSSSPILSSNFSLNSTQLVLPSQLHTSSTSNSAYSAGSLLISNSTGDLATSFGSITTISSSIPSVSTSSNTNGSNLSLTLLMVSSNSRNFSIPTMGASSSLATLNTPLPSISSFTVSVYPSNSSIFDTFSSSAVVTRSGLDWSSLAVQSTNSTTSYASLLVSLGSSSLPLLSSLPRTPNVSTTMNFSTLSPSSISAVTMNSPFSITISSSSSTISSITAMRSTSTSIAPTTVSTVSSYVFKGCYNETVGRTFAGSSLTNNTGMTVETCASYCTKYAWFGVEAGTQCYCGPYPRAGSGLTPSQADCKTPCVGDKTESCGSTNKLTAYLSPDPDKVSSDPVSPPQVEGYSYFGCVVDNPRMLQSKVLASDTMTVETCIDLADAGGYKYAGIEYGRECWVGNTLLNPTSTAPASACNMPCKGAVGELCGAGGRLSLYVRTPVVQ